MKKYWGRNNLNANAYFQDAIGQDCRGMPRRAPTKIPAAPVASKAQTSHKGNKQKACCHDGVTYNQHKHPVPGNFSNKAANA